jgi:four helix bundle protein
MSGTREIDITERTIQYSLRSIQLFKAVDELNEAAGKIIAKQYIRSATSIGANIHEAQSGESRMDFIHKMSIAQKEANESMYWLRVLEGSTLIPGGRLQPIIQETKELIGIITSIIVNAKKNLK